jgi:Xaa-Pro aminopeptidase
MRVKTWAVGIFLLLLSGSLAGFEKEPLSEYASRRARVAEEIKGNVLILFGQSDSDLVKFKQTDNFLYLTGFIEPDAVLVIDATGDRPQETLFIRPRDPSEERWTGVTMSAGAEGQKETGISNVKILADLKPAVPALLRRGRIFTETADKRSAERLRDLAPSARTQDVASIIASLRIRKSATEVDRIEKAVSITVDGHKAAARVIAPGMWEYQVEAALEYEFRRQGAERPSFPSIVGSGPNSTILHYNASTRQMKAGDLLVVDVGAEYSGYAGDVTRTYPVSGKFTPRQREIYQIVLEAQKRALEKVKPGATIRQVHRAAYDYIESKGYANEFPHGTSHHLGLYVHDVGDQSRPLEPGMVITVEPGIYIDREELGVRIEDDVVVTENGYRMLSNFPREIAEIEELMAARASANPQR